MILPLAPRHLRTSAQPRDARGSRPHGRAGVRCRARLAPLLAVLLMAACAGSDVDDRGGAPADTATPRALDEAAGVAAAAGAAPADSAAAECPMRGAWRRCSVVERLESAGLGPVLLAEATRQPSLAIPGTAYRLGSAELQLYLYADSAGAARQAAAVDAGDLDPAAVEGILRPPLVLHSQNLVVLLFDNNDRLRERVRLAIMAGLPRA